MMNKIQRRKEAREMEKSQTLGWPCGAAVFLRSEEHREMQIWACRGDASLIW